jgi:hypothetical protein
VKKIKQLLIGALCGILNGLLGSGGGVIAVLSLRKFLDVETHKAHATAVAVMLPLTIVSAVVYLGKYQTDIKTLILVTAGGIVGGIVGAKLLVKISSKWLHKVFGAVMIFAAVRMLF